MTSTKRTISGVTPTLAERLVNEPALGDACNAVQMTGRAPKIEGEWISALRRSLGLFGALVLEPRVREVWSDESCLPGYTVGGIAGHVLSLMVGLQRRIEARDFEVETIRYSEWYGSALSSREMHAGLIRMGEELATRGPLRLAADLEATGEGLARCLRESTTDLVVPLASLPGAGVRLDDFLRTRFVEITVHADDVAASVGLGCPDFPATAWALAAEVLSETSGRQGAGARFVLTTSRPDRPRSDYLGDSC